MQDRIDHHFATFEAERERLRDMAARSVRNRRQARAAAWKMAKAYVSMETLDHNWLLGMIKGQKAYSGSDGITKWLDDSFAPLGLLGTSHHELLHAVSEGMSLAKYQSTEPRAYLGIQKTAQQAMDRDATPLPTAPADDLPVGEQVKLWKALAEALAIRLRHESTLRRTDQRRVTVLEREVAELMRSVRVVA